MTHNTPNSLLIATSTIADGNMSFVWGPEGEVTVNREKFLSKYNLTSADCVVMSCDHKDEITVVDSTHKNTKTLTEAFITKEKGVALFLLTADCLPITFYDPVQKIVALAHLGWKPTELKLSKKVISKLVNDFKSNPKNILVYVGPGISKKSYVFKDPIQATLAGWEPFLNIIPSGETQIDIAGYNQAQMLEAGLLPENIFIDQTDTTTSDQYFSHYRSKRITGEPEGRFVTVVVLK